MTKIHFYGQTNADKFIKAMLKDGFTAEKSDHMSVITNAPIHKYMGTIRVLKLKTTDIINLD